MVRPDDGKTEIRPADSENLTSAHERDARARRTGAEVMGFFDKVIGETGEYQFLAERMNRPWRDDIPLTDRGVIMAVLEERKDPVVEGKGKPGDMYVSDEYPMEGGVSFSVYSKSTRGLYVIPRVEMTAVDGRAQIVVKRAVTDSEEFDAVVSQPRLTLLLDGQAGVGEAILASQQRGESNGFESVIVTTTSRTMVIPKRG